ncbi:MAG: porin family protein [Bacteroidales bacterium]|jgi:hypothetical protein|nr:porin family protein [Bacteroidales bacterium]MCI2122289.1 porin family protein [Bacteroidales bacterium]MCI2145750.1 porin family protein [Bacteroidales bacterium]
MKKIILTLTLLCALVVAGNAQPRALGVRLGYVSQELSYQETLSSKTMLDITAGLGGNIWKSSAASWLDLTAAYDWVFNAGDVFDVYLGPAAGVGYGISSAYSSGTKRMRLNVGGQLGIECKCSPHFAISLDYRPMLNLLGNNDNVAHDMVSYYNAAIGLRYKF